MLRISIPLLALFRGVSAQTNFCASDVQKWVINDPVQAKSLASAANCSRGNFEVEWNGRVVIDDTIRVLDGTIMTITGAGINGNAFIDGGGNTQIFSVENAELHLNDVTVGNGNGTDGGAIYSSGSTLSFIDTHFVENKAFGDGGAVHVSGSSVSCEGSSFTNNTAVSRGGAMFSTNSMTVCGGTWIGNSAESSGAIRIGEGSSLSWSEDTIFESNSATLVGGVMAVGGGSIVSWEDCLTLFYSNIGGFGGAIYSSQSSNMSIGGTTTFDSNQAVGAFAFGQDIPGTGGAMNVGSSIVEFSGIATFTNNIAFHSGGGIYASESILHLGGELMMTGNNATKAGGAIYSSKSSISSSIDSINTFMSNYVGESGGAFAVESSHISLNGVTKISNNSGAFNINSLFSPSVVFWDGQMEISNNYGSLSNPDDPTSSVYYMAVSNCTLSWKGNTIFQNNTGQFVINQVSNVFWGEGHTQFIENNGNGSSNIGIFDRSNVSWSGDTDFVKNYGGSAIEIGDLLSSDQESFNKQILDFIKRNISNVDLETLFENAGTCTLSWTGKTIFIENNAGSLENDDGIGFGGALSIRNSNVSWESETEFIGNSAIFGGAIAIDGAHLSWTGETKFTSNEARDLGFGGCIGIGAGSSSDGFIDNPSTIVINGSTVFSDNKAKYGGAFHLTSRVVTTIDPSVDVIFSGNSASISGGALYLVNVGNMTDLLTLTNVTFMSNSALDGGAVHSIGSFVQVDGCHFEGNSAFSLGGALSSASGTDKIYNSVFKGNYAGTGGAVRVAGDTSITNCSFVENSSKEGQGSAVSNVGIMRVMNNVSFSRNTFDCSSKTFLEYISSGDSYAVACIGCTLCTDCFLEEQVPTCMDILEHSESDGGDTTLENISIDAGFWRATSTSREVLSCHNEDACVGGVTGSQSYCEEGYEGPYCSICSEGYSEHLSFSCRECSDNNTDTIIVAVILSVVGLIVIVALASYLTSSEIDSSLGISGVVKRYIPLQSLKIVIVTWQILTQFSSVANVTYPDVYQDFLDGLDFFNFDFSWILSAGCVVRIDFHDRLLASTIGPIVALAFLACTYTAASHVHRGKTDVLQRIDDKHMSMVLLLTFLVYSNVSSVLFKAFACEDLDDDKYYLRADYRIECDSSEHVAYQVYAGIMILVYTVGIPAMYGYLLFRDRDVLKTKCRGEDSSRIEAISDLWEPYRSNVFYYELIECTRRILLSSVVVFIYPNTSAQIAITILISFLFVVIFEAMSPYVSPWDRWISRLGQVVVFISMYVALLLKVDVSGERYSSQQAFEGILVTVHVFMVLLVVVESVVTLFYLKHEKVRDLEGPVPHGASTSTLNLSNSQERSEEELSI